LSAERNCYMLTGGVKTGGMKPIVEKYRTQGDREEFSHTERRHLNGAEMGYKVDIGPRTNQEKSKPRLSPIFWTNNIYIIFVWQYKSLFCKRVAPFFCLAERGPQRCVIWILNHLINSELDLEFVLPLSDKRSRHNRVNKQSFAQGPTCFPSALTVSEFTALQHQEDNLPFRPWFNKPVKQKSLQFFR